MKAARSSAVARAALAGAAATALLLGSAAHAQDAASGSTGVEEIVVTAEKRQTKLQKTPSAITALPASKLETQGITGVSTLQFNVPSMVFGDQSGYSFISIRGIGTDVTTTSAEPAVASYADGVYTGSLITQSLPSFDLERIEVLRGPQGTLYGRNATGGVINYISRGPSYNPEINLAGIYGSYNRIALDGSATGPLIADKLAFRLGGHFEQRDGYRKNLALDKHEYDLDEWSVRGAVMADPNEDVKITLRGDYLDQETSNSYMLITTNAIPAVAGPLDLMVSPQLPLGIFSQPASFFQGTPFLSPSDIALLNGGSIAQYLHLLTQPGPIAPSPDDSLKFSSSIPSRYAVKTGGASATVEWDVGTVTIKSITAWRRGALEFDQDSTGFAAPQVVFYPLRQSNTQWTQEFNISGTAFDDKLDWLVGAFYFHDKAKFSTTVWLPGIGEYVQAFSSLADADGPYVFNLSQPLLPFYQIFQDITATAIQDGPNYILGGPGVVKDVTIPSTAFLGFGLTQKSKSYAGFAQATYHLTDALRLTGGLRYTIDEKEVVRSKHSNLLLFFGAGNPDVVDLCDKEPEGKKWYALTGTAGVDYDVAERTMLYAKYSKGYKAGGFNPGECHGAFNPEKLDAFEAGVKSVFGEGQFSVNAAAFYYDYSDIQFTTFVPGASSIKNAGAAELYGLEVEFQAFPKGIPGFSVDGSVSWIHSEYTEGNPDRADGLFFDVTNRDLLDIRGNELIRSPKWKLSMGAQYQADLGGSGTLTLRGEAAWTDTIYNDIFNGQATFQEATVQPSYWVLNARAIWEIDDGKYSIQLFGENLSNEYYAVNRVSFNTPTTLVSVGGQYAAPRTFGLRVAMKLDDF
ncbi:MAG: TonB-dependent receptor [Alphaproteobacteria bacterium]|nr:TonB-dependent receptor [Alphaproteobacteria bacterium]